MNNELKELFRATIAQKDSQIAALKARVAELERELVASSDSDSPASARIYVQSEPDQYSDCPK